MAKTDLWVYSGELEPLGLICSAQSVIFRRSFCDVGEFQLTMSAQRSEGAALQRGRIVRVGGRAELGAVITGRKLSAARGGMELTVTGVPLKGLLSRRAVVPPTASEDPAAYGWDRIAQAPGETLLRHYVTRHAVSPSDSARRIPFLELEKAPSALRGASAPWQARWTALTEELRDICQWTGLGYNVDLDAKNRKLIFRTLQGRDLTGRDGGLTRVTFSPEFHNVTSVSYEEEDGAGNTVYALGAGEDEAQAVRVLYTTGEGEKSQTGHSGGSRSERTLSVGNLSLPDEIDTEGYHRIKSSARRLRSLTASLHPNGPFAYRKDWDLGDVVTVRLFLPALGETVVMHAPITQVTEVYERDGMSPRIEVVFGDGPVSLAQAIDNRVRRI